jgi:hypothetical protein
MPSNSSFAHFRTTEFISSEEANRVMELYCKVALDAVTSFPIDEEMPLPELQQASRL